jgi:hypothetical protein
MGQKTMHQMDKATKAIGYEVAELEVGGKR